MRHLVQKVRSITSFIATSVDFWKHIRRGHEIATQQVMTLDQEARILRFGQDGKKADDAVGERPG